MISPVRYCRVVAKQPPLYYRVKSRAKSGDPDIIHFNTAKQLSAKVRAKVKRLGVEFGSELSDDLAEFPNVEYLAIEGVHLSSLTAAMVAKSVRMLHIGSDESTKYTLPPDLVLPQVESVLGPCKLVFRGEQLPNVKRLEVKIATPKMPTEIAKLPLTSLGIGPIANKASLAPFAKLALRELALSRGTAKNLAGVEMFSNLDFLGVNGMKSLSDISAIASLKKLTKLDISWCTGLKKVDAIGKLPKLAVADFWSSDMPLATWKKLEKQLRAKKVKIGNFPDCVDDEEDEDDE